MSPLPRGLTPTTPPRTGAKEEKRDADIPNCGFARVLGLVLARGAKAQVIELPANNGRASGIGAVAGWKCQAGQVTIRFDGGEALPAAYGIARADTQGSCGDRNNGWVMQFNYSLLGDGSHVARVYDNGTQFAESRFTVMTFGVPFLRGVSGAYILENFPSAGTSARVEWDQASQGFVVTNRSGPGPTPGPTPVPVNNCPLNGPLMDLRRDCSSVIYFYSRGSVLAGYLTDGETIAICMASPAVEGILCFGGRVRSAADFGLSVVRADDGPFLPLGSGSEGRMRNGWRTLDLFIRLLSGETYNFSDFGFLEARVSTPSEPLGEGLRMEERLSNQLEEALLSELTLQTERGEGFDAPHALIDPAGATLLSELVAEMQRQAE